jgi:hypothetical protein
MYELDSAGSYLRGERRRGRGLAKKKISYIIKKALLHFGVNATKLEMVRFFQMVFR